MAKFFIISGPSGVGKDAIVNELLEKHPKWSRLKTTTTRDKMSKEDRKYNFLLKEEFKDMIDRDKMFEWAKVHDNYYGASWQEVRRALKSPQVEVFDVDVKGAQHYKKELEDQVFTIFLKPKIFSNLKKRLVERKRGENRKEITKRLERAKDELKLESEFDQSVINPQGKMDQAVEEIEKIIIENS